MKKLVLSFMTVVSMSFVLHANDNIRHNEISKVTSVKEEIKVDSFKVVEIEEGQARKRGCSVTVNYYYQGQYVGQQTYGGDLCPILGVGTCGEWRSGMIKNINSWVHSQGTMLPAGNDYTC